MPDPITPGHAARILARAAAIDMRKPNAAADEVWSSSLTLAGVDYRDCLTAVDVHYAESADPIKPFHVIVIARRLAANRAAIEANRLALAPPPDDALPTEEGTRRVLAMLAAHRATKRDTGTDGPGTAASDDDRWPDDNVLTETYPGSGIYE